MKRCKFQLYEQGALVGGGRVIESAGGVVYVAQDGSPSKQAITDVNGTVLANPRALTNGSCEFYVPDTVSEVDLFIQCPDGEFLVVKNARVEQIDDLYVDKSVKHQCMVIPFDEADAGDTSGGAIEVDSGFVEPASGAALILPNPAAKVTTVDATETLDVGTMGTSNDPNGFLAGIALDNAALVKGTLANAGLTMGALLFVQDSANAGDEAPEARVSGGDPISWTVTQGTDTAKGYIYLPYVLMP